MASNWPEELMYSQEVKNHVCRLIGEGYSLRHIEAIKGMPTKTAVMNWCLEDKTFLEQYARAKEQQAEAFAEEILDIVDDSRNDWIERETKNGGTFIALNEEAVARSRMRMDARKWLMGKMKPKKYGDSLSVEGDLNLKTVKVVNMTGKADKSE